MKSRIPKRQLGTFDFATFLAHCCETIDSSIPQLRTAFLIAGVFAAGLQTGQLADFLFVTGLLLQFSICFEHWWLHPDPK
jgi:hypothetical protein